MSRASCSPHTKHLVHNAHTVHCNRRPPRLSAVVNCSEVLSELIVTTWKCLHPHLQPDGDKNLRHQGRSRASGCRTPDHLKTPTGEEAFNPNGLAQRSIALLKDTFPDLEARTRNPLVRPLPPQMHVKPASWILLVACSFRLNSSKLS